MLGKIEISDLIKLKATVSLWGIVNAYIDCGFGPYFTVGGMFTASAHSGGGHNTISGGYLEIGIKVNSNVGISLRVLWWTKEWKWTLYSNNFSFFSLGEKKVPLYFTNASEELTAEYSCETSFDVSSIINLNAVLQDMSSMKTSTEELTCSYYLEGEHNGVTLTEDGTLTIPATNQEEITVYIKIVSGNIYKHAQITFTVKHNEQLSAYQAPTCTQPGMTEYTYCTSCGEVLSGEKTMIAAKGHTYVASVTKEPSCNREGEMTYTCSVCDDSYTESIPMTAHTEAVDEAVAPTCTTTGLTEGRHCSVCGKVLIKQEVVPTIAHNYMDGICTECGAPEPQLTEGLVFTRSYDGTQYSVTDYTGTPVKVYIPATYKGLPVTSIGYQAFYNCSSLTSITIGNGVTSMGYSAFEGCTSLTSITFGNSSKLTSIGYWAFKGCSGLTSITIPDSVTSIGSSAFNNTAYYNDESNWENDVLYIGNHLIMARSTRSGTYSIKIGTKTIADSAFIDCNSLTSITIPDSVTSIGYLAFWGCSKLTSITIPDSVTSIGGRAFEDCSSLTSVTFGNSSKLTSIGWSAFYDCNSLTSITIPDSVTSIGQQAFNNTAYYNDESNWENDVLYIGNHLIMARSTRSGTYSIKIGTKTIADSAFRGWSGWTSITIPSSVTSIGERAFEDCSSLTSVTFGVNSRLTSIGDDAFYGCSGLTSIMIPDSVISIGSSAFEDCSSLTSITIPGSVTSIGSLAFGYCSKLTSVTFVNPNGWWRSTSSTATSGTSISSIDLSDPSTAARYLTSTYCSYYWKRS